MKNVVWLLLLVSMLFVAPIVEGEERPTTPPYQGPPGGYGSPGTPDNIPRGMPSPFPLPPPIAFPAPPEVIVMPETSGVYVVPDIDVDLFFWDGFWWRLWEGRWYRSAYFDREWVYYNSVPNFYFNIDPHWRYYYKNHIWYGHRWNYQRIPYERLHQNWKRWQTKKSWGGQKTWGVQGYVPRTQAHTQVLKQQRQQEYQQRPEVQKHQQYMQQQRQVQKPQVQQQQRQPQRSQEKPGRGEEEHRK